MTEYPNVSFEISQEKDEKVCIQRPEGLPLKISGKVNITKYVDSVYKLRLKDIQASRNLLQNEWDKVNTEVMKRLQEIMDIEWPNKNITGFMTLNKICPRDLKDWFFFVEVFANSEVQKGICLHEITHFLFFEKWKQVFKNFNEKEFDKPGLAWSLSEILVEPINEDHILKRLVPTTAKAYERYYKIKIKEGNESIMDHFRRIYADYNSNFAELLKVSYDEIKRLKAINVPGI
ncbi:hypothetical protein [Caldisphaera sp.]|uniref:hypothetical protein n=1 Tax=Caldisphaera sp. TaxID=2060322 RepID=UPI0025BB2742|nr:hypothetical protein [Caldisphaera sp.]